MLKRHGTIIAALTAALLALVIGASYAVAREQTQTTQGQNPQRQGGPPGGHECAAACIPRFPARLWLRPPGVPADIQQVSGQSALHPRRAIPIIYRHFLYERQVQG